MIIIIDLVKVMVIQFVFAVCSVNRGLESQTQEI